MGTGDRSRLGKAPQVPEQRLACGLGRGNSIKGTQAVAPPAPHPGTSAYGLEELLTVESPFCSKLS